MLPADRSRYSSTLAAWAFFVAPILIQLLWGTWLAARYSPTGDEVAHLMAGVVHWRQGRTDIYAVNPPLSRLLQSAPAVFHSSVEAPKFLFGDPYTRPEFEQAKAFADGLGTRLPSLLFEARLVSIGIWIVGGILLWDLATRIFGDPVVATVAHLLWATTPCLAGHGVLVGPDVAGVVTSLAALWGLVWWLHHPTWQRVLVLGICVGLALATKFTNFPLAAIIPLAMIASRILGAVHLKWKPAAMQSLAVVFVALVLLNAFYPVDEWGIRLGLFSFRSQALGGDLPAANRFAGTALEHIPSPLPRSVLLGIDLQKVDFDRQWPAWLLGQWREGGFPHYYVVAMLLKIPTLAWLLAIIGAGRLAWAWREMPADSRIAWLAIALFCSSVLVAVSCHTNLNHHPRYVLPVYPAVLLLAAVAFVDFAELEARWRWPLCALLVGAMIESATTLRDPIAGYNFARQWIARTDPPFLSSGTDWGQGVRDAIDWIDANIPEKERDHVSWLVQTPLYSAEKVYGRPFHQAPRNPDDRWLQNRHVVIVSLDKMYEDRCWTGPQDAATWYRERRHRAKQISPTMFVFELPQPPGDDNTRP